MSTTLREFYDAHGDAPDELVHGQRHGHGLVAAGPSQVQRSPTASQGDGGHRQGGRALSCNARGRRAQQAGGAGRPRPAGWRSWQAAPSPSADARARASSSPAGPAHPSVA
jgi:hypothetical protein